MSFDPRNILVIDFGQLGDVVLSLPALHAIRKHFPKAAISVAVGKPGAEVVELSGYADSTLMVDRVALRDGPKLVSLARIAKLVQGVRRSRFEHLIDEASRGMKLRDGGALEDVAPTILGLLGIATPAEMTGRDLRDS